MTGGKTLAVLDLGSNSFHMVVAQTGPSRELRIIDRIKERARLAAGLDKDKRLTPEAQARALGYIEQFSERLEELSLDAVRVVATDSFRRAKNGEAFLLEACEVLGWPIEVISGLEEARLIYKGVSFEDPTEEPRLVVDIGGGSTEVIIGRGSRPADLASFHMGCVSFTERYFPGGELSRPAFQRARTAASQTVSSEVRRLRKQEWMAAYGTSGTNKAIGEALMSNGITDGGITLEGLDWLEGRLVQAGHTGRIVLPQLSESRTEVLAGGMSVLRGLMESLRIERMFPLQSALREGVLYELAGRIYGEDVRDQSVRSMTERFSLDRIHAGRVERTAMSFFEDVAADWGLDEEARKRLGWACRLHEVGMSIAFSGFQKHGSYIVKNADMPGFSRLDQAVLAQLLRAQRGKIKLHDLEALLPYVSEESRRLILIIRLATRLNRRRSPKNPPRFSLKAGQEEVVLFLPEGYLKQRQLTRADMLEEEAQLVRLGFRLVLAEHGNA